MADGKDSKLELQQAELKFGTDYLQCQHLHSLWLSVYQSDVYVFLLKNWKIEVV